MQAGIRVLAALCIIGIVFVCGCITNDGDRVNGTIDGLEADSRLYLSADTLFHDSNIVINYSLELHNLVIGQRYRLELEFESGLGRFIQGYGTESYATDSTARYSWSFFALKSQSDTLVRANLKINSFRILSDTAVYRGKELNSDG